MIEPSLMEFKLTRKLFLNGSLQCQVAVYKNSVYGISIKCLFYKYFIYYI